MKKELLLFLFLFTAVISYAQTQQVNGVVIDSQTKEVLPFVNISIEGSNQAATTDIDGKFSIASAKKINTLLFSYVGYELKRYPLPDSSATIPNLVIRLESKHINLSEITIRPGEDPAQRLMRIVHTNRDKNDPEKLRSFSYDSYNKFVVTSRKDSGTAGNNFGIHVEVTTSGKPTDSAAQKEMDNFFEKQNLFLMESVTTRKYMKPGKNQERILASRVSGISNPQFMLLATQLQSFSFYNDLIYISNKKYVSPLSKEGLRSYFFVIEDTLFSGNDTLFTISFRPGKGENFDGLKGVININTHGYAVQNVIAEPADRKQAKIKIQQNYELVDNRYWFPAQLNADMLIADNLVGISHSYIQHIKLEPELDKKTFNRFELEMADDVKNKSEAFWNAYRVDTLTEKDKKTYVVIDSIGKESKLDGALNLLMGLRSGKISGKVLTIDLDRFVDVNRYEGLRLGAGLHTSDQLLNWLSVGGYAAYGFKDKAMKYGGDALFKLPHHPETSLRIEYSKDVIESGSTYFMSDRKPTGTEINRAFLVNTMDGIEKKQASLNFRVLQYLKTTVFLNQQSRSSKNEYRFQKIENGTPIFSNLYQFTEAGLALKFAFREKFAKIANQEFSMGSTYPILWAQVTKGINGFLGGTYTYTRYDVKLEKSFTISTTGKALVQFSAGYVDGNLPYTLLYAGKGSYMQNPGNNYFQLSASNSFETMRFNEFLSNRYASLFCAYHFERYFYMTKYSKPRLVLIHNMGWGALNNSRAHVNVPVRTMEKGYYESGIVIKDMLNTKIVKLGLGAFYRYGPYANARFKDNFALKLSMVLSDLIQNFHHS